MYKRQALDIKLAVLGERHPEVATSHGNIGSTLSRLGKYEEALVEHRAALDVYLAVLGERHPNVAAIRSNISRTLSNLGQYEEALVEERAAPDIRLAVLGERYLVVGALTPYLCSAHWQRHVSCILCLVCWLGACAVLWFGLLSGARAVILACVGVLAFLFSCLLLSNFGFR